MVKIAVKKHILNAAKQRFTHYGYRKTTMAEIAQDCDMSAANLYRYFDNKLAIAGDLAAEILAEKEQLLAAVLAEEIPAADKLERFTMVMLHHAYHYFESMPKMNELVEAVMTERPDLLVHHRNQKRALIEQLLLAGQEQGEFTFEDITQTVDAIHSAILLFYWPLTLSLYTLDELENKAHNVCVLLVSGLTPPQLKEE